MYSAAFSPKSIQTERLFVLFDAGETTALLPVMQELERIGKDFRVLVMATAETRITPDMFKAKRLTLADLGVTEKIDATTPRTTKLKRESLEQIASRIDAKAVIVGTAARIQRQIFKKAFPHAVSYACPDNFNYDPDHESYQTVRKVAAAAKVVLCPDADIAHLLQNDPYVKSKAAKYKTEYAVVGKASLDAWEQYIKQVLSPGGIAPLIQEKKQKIAELMKSSDPKAPETREKIEIEIEQLVHLDSKIQDLTRERKRVVTLIGGYGPGYDVVDPLFQRLAESLKKNLDCEVFYQLHPKRLGELAITMGKQAGISYITTEQALALNKLTQGIVVGYNSSVPFEAALIGIDACYIVPEKTPSFKHKAVEKGMVPAVKTE
ncbi:MAG: hypothetical protein LLG04_18680, partial [Parachlamydia sp.]|nr:hypothetical protein [Parachlamydia sp.]